MLEQLWKGEHTCADILALLPCLPLHSCDCADSWMLHQALSSCRQDLPHRLPLWECEDLTLKPTLEPLLVTNVTVTVMANFPWSYFLGCPAIFLVPAMNLGFSCCSSNSNCPLQDYTEKWFNTVLHWAKGDTKYRQVCKHFSRQVITVARRVYLPEVVQIFSI